MIEKKYGAFSSSEDPEKLGDTIKAVILGLSTLIIFVGNYFGLEIGSKEVTEFAIGLGSTVSTLWGFYGLIKKLVVKVAKK